MQIEIGEDEIGYVALHVHSAIEDEKVSVAMQVARTVRECMGMCKSKTKVANKFPRKQKAEKAENLL